MRTFCRTVLTGLLLLLSTAVFGQAASFEATASKTQIQLGERVMVTFDFKLKSDYRMQISNFTPPQFQDFQLYAGPLQQSSFRFENGRQTRGIQYSYVLVPRRAGTFVIGPAQIQLEGQRIKTKTLTITVKATRAGVAASSASPGASSGSGRAPARARDLHFVLQLSDKSPYVGQAITATYLLYTRNRNLYDQLSPTDFPKFPGFWNQEVEIGRPDYEQTRWQGEDYYRIVLRELVLIPQKAGKLTVDPFAMEVTLLVNTGQYDFFGRSVTAPKKVKVSTGQQFVRVKPLPAAGRPADFSGAVGQFKLRVGLDKTSLKAGASARLKVQVSGTGNLKLFDLPEPEVPADLERYQPKYSARVRTTGRGLSGSLSDEYVVVPRYRGHYEIPPVHFSYFDPAQGRYQTLQSPSYPIRVTGGPTKGVASVPLAASNPNQKVKVLDRDIRYIQSPTRLEPLAQEPFFSSRTYYWLLFTPLLLIVFIAFSRKLRPARREANPAKYRRKAAHKRLSEARKRLQADDNRAFYTEVERALLGFVSAVLHLDQAQLTRESIREALQAEKLDEKLIEGLMKTLDQSQFERYTAGVNPQRMQEIYDRAAEIITQLDKALKK